MRLVNRNNYVWQILILAAKRIESAKVTSIEDEKRLLAWASSVIGQRTKLEAKQFSERYWASKEFAKAQDHVASLRSN